MSSNQNNPSKFWKTIKSLEIPSSDSALPKHVVKDTQQISNKNAFNDHFIKAGDVFEQSYPEEVKHRHFSIPLQHKSPASTVLFREGFNFKLIASSAELKALNEIDARNQS